MSLILTVPDDIARAAEEAVLRSGMPPEHILLNALRAHFPPIPAKLHAEVEALERASDEDFACFEQNEGAGHSLIVGKRSCYDG